MKTINQLIKKVFGLVKRTFLSVTSLYCRCYGIFLIAVILGSSPSMATNLQSPSGKGVLKGIVVDDQKNPLFNVNVGLVGTRHGAATGENGEFMIKDVPPGAYVVGASMVGHEDNRHDIVIKAGEASEITLVLPGKSYSMPQINVIAQRKGVFETVPGSLTYIDGKDIRQISPVSGNEVLRRSPGVHVVDEEGLGMRANVGIRGLDPDRSRSVLILEDGIPVALSPYGEPEMYYTPAMERMEGVEILKGSGSILYGPQTIGGVINYITANPPLEPSGSASIRGSRGGYFTGLFSYGNSSEKAGYQVTYLRKQADSVGISSFNINDLSTKLRLQSGKNSNLALKLGFYDESSNSTYLGITQPMFDAGGEFDLTRVAPYDQLLIRRYSAGLIHNYFFTNNTRLTTTAYGYTTTRNWQRQDYSYNTLNEKGSPNPPPGNATGVVWGDISIPGGAIYMQNSTGNRNRQFEVAGAETRLQANFSTAGLKNEFTAGGRFHYERAFEQRINGTHANASSGNLLNDEIRTGVGTSSYLHNRVKLSERVSFTLGLRLEHFEYERDIRRRRFTINNETKVRDTLLVAGSSVTQFIPGAGFNLLAGSATTVFGGVHRGFAPPRVKDAVSNNGLVYHLDAEKSWNTELGIRQKTPIGISWELTGFYMDFSNQVIPVSESSGGAGSGLVNGGRTWHRGAEMALISEISKWWGGSAYTITLDAGITFVDARFGNDRFIGSGDDKINIKGNKTPYSPEWTIQSAVVFEHQSGWMTRFSLSHIEEQYTDILNTVEPHNNGRVGLIPAYTVFNGCVSYFVENLNATFRVSVKNLTNERYMVTRRPQGIRLGMPRMVIAGISLDF